MSYIINKMEQLMREGYEVTLRNDQVFFETHIRISKGDHHAEKVITHTPICLESEVDFVFDYLVGKIKLLEMEASNEMSQM